jgi:hypothetical protein
MGEALIEDNGHVVRHIIRRDGREMRTRCWLVGFTIVSKPDTPEGKGETNQETVHAILPPSQHILNLQLDSGDDLCPAPAFLVSGLANSPSHWRSHLGFEVIKRRSSGERRRPVWGRVREVRFGCRILRFLVTRSARTFYESLGEEGGPAPGDRIERVRCTEVDTATKWLRSKRTWYLERMIAIESVKRNLGVVPQG